MRQGRFKWVALGLVLVVATGCATGRALRSAKSAADQGDWDTAVAYYREVLSREPGRIDVRVALERAMRNASLEHLKRARDLEAQDQLPGAIAEYKLAADLDPGNTLALTKALELERRLKELIEAARPPTRMEGLRQVAAQTSPIPRLDPRQLANLRFTNAAVRDILNSISALTQINITYDQGVEPSLGRPYTIEIQQLSVEEIFHQVLTANQLTFKVINPTTIFVYQDTTQKRQQWDDVYTQTFYLSHADSQEIVQIINQMVTQGAVVRPALTQNKNLNSIVVKATAPVLQAIDVIIRANDKPRAEVMVEAEILEVDRVRVRQLGIDLNQYALGFTFSPELAPPTTAGTFPPATPPPFNLNTISRGASTSDVYVTTPSALVRLLESDTSTKVLARSQLRGREGAAMALRLGDLVPIPTTVFQSGAAGGIQNIPTTQVQYQSVGVNLLFTPRVTFQDEIIIENLTVEKSGLGNFLEVGGQSFPTIVTRQAQSSLRLRDGESNLLAGLLREEDRTSLRSLPGIMNVPILRSLFGNTDRSAQQTDIVMIITPRIVRSHELTPADLQPTYVGTFQNFGLGRVPPLISPDAPLPGTTPPGAPPATAPPTTPPVTEPAPARAPGVVAIQPVGAEPAGQGQVTVTVGGEQQAGGPLFTVPLTVSSVTNLGTVSVTITYDPAVIEAASIVQGTFMQQGGATPTFVPKIDVAAGRIEIVVARPGGSGASGQGLLAGIQFRPLAAGTAQIAVTAVGTSAAGQSVDLRGVPAVVVVR